MSAIKPPRMENFGPTKLVGLRRHHSLSREFSAVGAAIEKQWRDFLTISSGVQGLSRKVSFGVCFCMADGATSFDYLAGCAVSGNPVLANGLMTLELPAARCAVFQHREHPSELRETYHLILGTVLPLAGLEPADVKPGAPEFIERFPETFNHADGTGGLEVLVPLKV